MKRSFLGKSNRNLSWLLRDHYNKLVIVCKIRRDVRLSVSPHHVFEYILKEFVEHLELHFLEEEEWLFPNLPKEDPLRMEAERQHKCMREVVKKTCSPHNDNVELAIQFADLLEEHIRFEQRTLSPCLENLVDKNEFESLSQKEIISEM